MMVIKSSIKNEVLHALYKAVGLNTPGGGIAFTMPVEDVVGLTPELPIEPPSEEKADSAEEKPDSDK